MNGERAPAEVYRDFRTAVLDILGAQENQEALLNGVAGMGKGANEIPGSIVSVDTAPSQQKQPAAQTNAADAVTTVVADMVVPMHQTIMGQTTRSEPLPAAAAGAPTVAATRLPRLKQLPPVICVIGGPGSNKAMLCMKMLAQLPGWGHFRWVTLLSRSVLLISFPIVASAVCCARWPNRIRRPTPRSTPSKRQSVRAK